MVLQASPGGWLIERCVGRVPRGCGSSLEVESDHDGSMRRVPVRGRCLGSLKAPPFHEAASAASLTVSLGSSCTALVVVQSGSDEGPTPLDLRRTRDGDIRGSIALSPWEENAHASWVAGSPVPFRNLRSSAIHRSVHRGVKPRSTSGPRKRRVVVPQSSALEILGTHEIRVFVSTVWMAEVGP